MGRHSVQRESRMPASVKSAILFGAVATGSLPAIPAAADTINTPFGSINVDGVSQKQVDDAVTQVNKAAPGLLPQNVQPGPATAMPQMPNLAAAVGQLPGQNSRGDAALNAARSKLGTRYVWGGTGGAGFDCSGLVQWAYKQVGVKIGRTSFEQAREGRPVALRDLRPGDILITNGGGHAQMYAGDGKVIEALQSGVPVKYSQFDPSSVYAARRV